MQPPRHWLPSTPPLRFDPAQTWLTRALTFSEVSHGFRTAVCLHCPLCRWWPVQDSNLRHPGYEPGALPLNQRAVLPCRNCTGAKRSRFLRAATYHKEDHCPWRSIPDSNRHDQLGRLRCYRYINAPYWCAPVSRSAAFHAPAACVKEGRRRCCGVSPWRAG